MSNGPFSKLSPADKACGYTRFPSDCLQRRVISHEKLLGTRAQSRRHQTSRAGPEGLACNPWTRRACNPAGY
jgi:hypothetical protein